jgi:hypothetical protein
MIYKLRKEIDLCKLDIRWMVYYNHHPGTSKIVEEKLDELDMDDYSMILCYPHFMNIIVTRLSILNSPYLSKNPDAMHILMKNPDLIDWSMLSTNPNPKALEIIEENIIYEQMIKKNMNHIHRIKKIKEVSIKCKCPQSYLDYPAFWRLLATNTNPKAIELIENYYPKLHDNHLVFDEEVEEFWSDLSKNEGAVHLLEKFPHFINWKSILENPNPKAINMIEKNLDKIYEDDWPLLSGNPAAVHIFEKPEYLNKVYDWGYLCKNPNAIHIIINNWDKVDWITFSRNPSAIHIILQLLQEQKVYNIRKIKNMEIKEKFGDDTFDLYSEGNHTIYRSIYKYYDDFYKISYRGLSMNPAIFEEDYNGLKKRCDIYRKELMEKANHPSRILALLDQGIDLEDLEDYF